MSARQIRLAVTGASGRMGTRILALAGQDKRFQLVAGVERAGSANIGRFTPDGRAPIVGDVAEIMKKTDVMIDFTEPQSTLQNAAMAARTKTALVIGTTGLKPAQLAQLKKAARRIPIVFSPNMSIGVNMLFKLVAQAAEALGNYDIEIIEAHHNQKKDAPSGTAMKLAQIAAESSKRSEKDFVFGRSGVVGARKKKEIGVLAVRAGDIVGDHTVMISTGGERLELTHRAHSRDAFASGALTAAAWIYKRRPGLYSMQDVLNSSLRTK